MRLTIAYSEIKKQNLVLINNATHQRETLWERPVRQPLESFDNLELTIINKHQCQETLLSVLYLYTLIQKIFVFKRDGMKLPVAMHLITDFVFHLQILYIDFFL